MVGLREQRVRKPAVAGLFYPDDPNACREQAAVCLRADEAHQDRPWLGGIVPHAGWVCSGELAGRTIATMARRRTPRVVVVFGAIHTPIPASAAMLDSHQRWEVPSGVSDLPPELHQKLLERSELFNQNERFHRREHAVEVELPLIQFAWPNAAILPVEVPTEQYAVDVGRQAARLIQALELDAVFLASSDLTHYGPNYCFAPAGVGAQGLIWAMENDRRLLALVERMEVERIVPETQEHLNACGGGAIAAMLAACREFGADEARILRHANSCQTLERVAPQPTTNAVGYASVVVG